MTEPPLPISLGWGLVLTFCLVGRGLVIRRLCPPFSQLGLAFAQSGAGVRAQALAAYDAPLSPDASHGTFLPSDASHGTFLPVSPSAQADLVR